MMLFDYGCFRSHSAIRRRHGCSRNRQELLPLGKSFPKPSYTSTFHRRELHNSKTKSSGFNRWTGRHSMRPGNATRTCCGSAQITSYRSGVQVQTFYNGSLPTTQETIDAASGGSLNNKTLEEAEELIETLASNHYAKTRDGSRKQAGVYEEDQSNANGGKMTAIQKKLKLINKRI